MINVYGANESTFTKNGLATLRPISADFIPQINGSWVLKCTVPFDEQLKYQYIEEQNIVQVDQACIREIGLRQLFRIYEVTKNLDSVSFIACPLGMEAVYDAPIEEIQITNKTGVQAVAALSDYLTEHGVTKYTLASDITRTATTEFENTNLIAAISGNDDNSLVNKYAGEVVYDNATIYLKNKVGLQDKARTVAYGRNLTGLKCNIDTSNMITRVYPISNDDLRLHEYPDTEIPTGQTYIDTSDPDAPIRAAFIDTDYKLVDTTKTSNSATATKTREWQAAILDAITSKAEELWDTAIDDMTNTYCPDYIKGLVNGDDGIIKYTQARYVYSHKGWQSIIKSLIKQGVEWIKEAEVPEKAWIHLDGYWYGTQNADGSRKNYARNQYIYAYSEASWYWFDNMGIMSTDTIPQETIDLLNTYTWHTDEHGQYYGDGNGHYLTNAWVENQNQTHSWVGADGYYIPEKDDASTWAWTDIDGYLYGSSVDNYAKSKYEIVNKKLEYFGSDGFWREWMTLKFADMGWFQNSDESSPNYKKWWYGSTNRNYAHNEYVYMTVEGTMKEWWYDAEGWYDEDSSGDSDYGWHGNAADGFWFGEEDAGTEDKNKYIHDKWAFIDGTYYWFNSEGYISADATLAIPDWPWGDQISEVTGKHWFGNPDEDFNRVWVSNQWLEIDGDWYYFDSDGYMVDKKSPTITWFSDTIVNGASSVILACLTEAYNLLYTQMTDWVERQFAEGLDKPAITIDVDMVDISNTSDYADYKDLERICLGDKVKCYGNHGIEIEARVVGLTYDLIRGYNTKVTIGQLGKSLSQILKVSYQGASDGQKLVAGDNVVIDGKVISVEDNTGAVAGLKDATLEGVSIVHGNVARLNDIYRELTQAQYNNLSSQEKNSGKLFYITDTQTIMHKNVAYGGGNISYGTSTPTGGSDGDVYFQTDANGNIVKIWQNHSGVWGGMTGGGGGASIDYGTATPTGGVDGDVYLQLEETGEPPFGFYASETLEVTQATDTSIKIEGVAGNDAEYVCYKLAGLTIGQEYVITFDAQLMQDVSYYSGSSYRYGAMFNDTFEYGGTVSDYVAFVRDTSNHSYTTRLTPIGEEAYFWVQTGAIYNGQTIDLRLTNINITPYPEGTIDSAIIKDIWLNDNGMWINSDFSGGGNVTDVEIDGTSILDQEGVANITTMEGATSATDGTGGLAPKPLMGDEEKFLCGDGTWKTVEGGGGANLILDAQRYSLEEKVVGVWTDEKPLYQRTFEYSAGLNLNSSGVALPSVITSELTDVDKFVRAEGVRTTSGLTQAYIGMWVNSDRKVYTADPWSKVNIFTFWYTKTTDTAGSGGYQAYGFSPIIYSDVEREVGVWKDNKPLYQKTIIIQNNVAWSNNTTFDNTISDADAIWIYDGYIYDGRSSANVIQPNPIIQSTDRGGFTIDISNKTKFKFVSSATFSVNSSRYAVLTVRYTKTTDVAGGGEYNTLAIPNVHYSTDEQVIGTWIDGKPLYQKSFIISPLTINTTKTALPSSILTELSDIDTCISGFCVRHKSEGVTSNATPLSVWIDGSTMYVYSIVQCSNMTHFTFQYTKTTD